MRPRRGEGSRCLARGHQPGWGGRSARPRPPAASARSASWWPTPARTSPRSSGPRSPWPRPSSSGTSSPAPLGAAMFVVAGVFAFLALILLLIAAAYGLVAAGLSPWLAFLIVGGVLLLIGAACSSSSASRGWARSGRRSGPSAPPRRPWPPSSRPAPATAERPSGAGRAHVRRRRVVRPGRGPVGAPVRRRGRQPLPRRRAGRGPARPTAAWVSAVLVGLAAPARDPGRGRLPGRGDGPARLRRLGQDPARLRHHHLGRRRRQRHPLAR